MAKGSGGVRRGNNRNTGGGGGITQADVNKSIAAIDKIMADFRSARRASGLSVERGSGQSSGRGYARKMGIIDLVRR